MAERGKWAERFMDAYVLWTKGAVDVASLRYLFLAELGYEAAQTNFAWLMDEERSGLFPQSETYQRALLSWQRAANQDYAVARVKLGDYKYYGLGTPVDMAEAANHYKIAATSHQSAQAMFNLGYMHECGLGVNRDLHLAKRYYDMAAETSTDSFVPVTLSLMKLRMEFAMDYLLAVGRVGTEMSDSKSLSEIRPTETRDEEPLGHGGPRLGHLRDDGTHRTHPHPFLPLPVREPTSRGRASTAATAGTGTSGRSSRAVAGCGVEVD